MRICVAKVGDLSGNVSAIDGAGGKRQLSIGDQVHMDEVVRTALNSYVEISIDEGSSVKIEALQSIRLTEEIFPSQFSNADDSVINAGLPAEVVNQLFSAYPFEEPSILSDIEPVFDLSALSKLDMFSANPDVLVFDDFLLPSIEKNSLERFLQFDQTAESTKIYFSIQGVFTDSNSAQMQADKVITINSVGYRDSAELLSYLIENYQLVEQS